MTTFDESLAALRSALRGPPQRNGWSWLVRQRMSGVRDALLEESAGIGEAWLAARESTVLRDRNLLLERLAVLGRGVLDTSAPLALRPELDRLLVDLEHHRQRLSDLVYDSVALELGGSE